MSLCSVTVSIKVNILLFQLYYKSLYGWSLMLSQQKILTSISLAQLTKDILSHSMSSQRQIAYSFNGI